MTNECFQDSHDAPTFKLSNQPSPLIRKTGPKPQTPLKQKPIKERNQN